MMIRWLAVAVFGALAAASAALWPDATFELERERQPVVYSPVREAQDGARREALETAAQIMTLRQVDRFAAEAVAAHAAGRAFDVVVTDSARSAFDPAQAVAVDQRARALLDAWGLEEPRVAVGAYLTGAEGWPEGLARPGEFGEVRRFVDGRTADGHPYCIQVGRTSQTQVASGSPGWTPLDASGTGPSTFGACWLHARYGEPAPVVSEWMHRYGFAAAHAASRTPWAEMDDAERRFYSAAAVRLTSGLIGGQAPALADLCIEGETEACRALFLQGSWWLERDPARLVLPNSSFAQWTAYNYLPESWLYELETQYGPERMAAFWTSDAPDVVTAFETAFGVDLEATMTELGRERFGHIPPGPRLTGWGWIGLLASLALGIGAAGRSFNRRVVA
jgi:hypothetical protein